jgi:membrane protein required for beta-lactamase induction
MLRHPAPGIASVLKVAGGKCIELIIGEGDLDRKAYAVADAQRRNDPRVRSS